MSTSVAPAADSGHDDEIDANERFASLAIRTLHTLTHFGADSIDVKQFTLLLRATCRAARLAFETAPLWRELLARYIRTPVRER